MKRAIKTPIKIRKLDNLKNIRIGNFVHIAGDDRNGFYLKMCKNNDVCMPTYYPELINKSKEYENGIEVWEWFPKDSGEFPRAKPEDKKRDMLGRGVILFPGEEDYNKYLKILKKFRGAA